MRVYIAGKITGLNLDEARQEFERAEQVLSSIGHEPANPMKLVEQRSEDQWKAMMHDAIKVLVECDGIFMLSNYHGSRGARLELYVAEALGMEVMHEANA
jgi:hypothetical protein